MKKHIIINTLLLLGSYLALYSIGALSAPYHIAAIYFFSIYTIQAAILLTLKSNPQSFIVRYNFMVVFKMTTSLAVLVLYFLFFTETSSKKDTIQFCAVFMVLYFLYLTINTKLLFSNSNEKEQA
tara:strand:- start:70 stop:444 length:375 start_codon:yes stop_codon:yes gene_type:complete